MNMDVLFWTFLAGLCFALNGCCIFLILIRDGQYRNPEKAKFVMYENEVRDDAKFPRNLVEV